MRLTKVVPKLLSVTFLTEASDTVIVHIGKVFVLILLRKPEAVIVVQYSTPHPITPISPQGSPLLTNA